MAFARTLVLTATSACSSDPSLHEVEPAFDTSMLREGPPLFVRTWAVDSDAEGALLGSAVSSAGDVNGDGFADIIVGAPSFGEKDALPAQGRALVYLGSESGLGSSPSWVGHPPKPFGNLVPQQYGGAVSTAGDVNGDGYDDVIVGEPVFSRSGETADGRAHLYLGSESGLDDEPAWTADPGLVGAALGLSVASAGDVDGDGFDDVVVGAPLDSNGEDREGRVFLFRGSATGLEADPAWTAESDEVAPPVGTGGDNPAFFGESLASADVNGDGYDDVIVSAPYYNVFGFNSDSGRVYVYLGSAAGLESIASTILEGDQDRVFFGADVGSAGDVNGDGYDDVIVGATFYPAQPDRLTGSPGRAFVYLGSPTGLSTTAVWSATARGANQSFPDFGEAVSSAGDINQDGFGDVLVGSPGYETSTPRAGGLAVFLGSPDGVQKEDAWSTAGKERALLGQDANLAGDVNGDGYPDVVAGAPLFHGEEKREGAVFLYEGVPIAP